MPAEAYLHIVTSIGEEASVIKLLKQLPEVKRADVVTGEFDIITVIYANDRDKLLKLISTRIRKIKGIQRTVTSLVVE